MPTTRTPTNTDDIRTAPESGADASDVELRGDQRHRAASPSQGNPQANVGTLERGASIAWGAALIVRGLGRGNLSGLLTAAMGGSLIHRGVTGNCPMYTALGVNTSDMSTHRVE